MSLWGTTTADSDKPKFLPVDSNAAGSTGAREHIIAHKSGWALSPGLAASGNDNKNADPEILVCVSNIAEIMGSASVISIDWTDATVANVGTFDITITFDEAVDITSGSWSANQTITNKAYILLSRLGKTDMVEDSTTACQYFSGSGTNKLVFRGTLQTNAAAAFLAFNGEGVSDSGLGTAIFFDGSAVLAEEDGRSSLGIRQEAGTAAAGSAGDPIILNGTSGAIATVNGALSTSTTLAVDTLTGTLVTGQVITVFDTGTLAVSDTNGTAVSTNNTLTITAVGSQSSVTVSKAITVADNVILLFSADGGDEVNLEAIDFKVGGPAYATRSNITLIARTGETLGGKELLEEGTPDSSDNDDAIILNATDSSATDAGSYVSLEDASSGIATVLQAGTSSGSAYVLNGMDVAAA